VIEAKQKRRRINAEEKAVTLAVAGALESRSPRRAERADLREAVSGNHQLESFGRNDKCGRPEHAGDLAGASAAGDNKSRLSMDTGIPTLVSVHRDLGGGLKTIWQIESNALIDTGASGAFAVRDSFVGLTGGFGTVRLGNFDTVYKRIATR